jgi:hypothetical protein
MDYLLSPWTARFPFEAVDRIAVSKNGKGFSRAPGENATLRGCEN